MLEQQIDTFDDGEYTTGPMDEIQEESTETEDGSFAEVEGQSTEEETVQTEESEDFDTDSQVNLLDEKEEIRTEKEEKDGEKESDKSDEEDKDGDEEAKSESDSEDDAAKDSGETAEDVRTLKAFSDGKQYEIPENAEVKVKVDGKWEKVSLTDLRDNYAGKTAWDEKFTKLSDDRKDYEEKNTMMEGEMGIIKDHFTNIRQLTEKGMSGEIDPLSATNYLLDLMGINTLEFNKNMFNHMSEQYDAYSEMTELERENHWTKRENEYLVKKQESSTKRQSEDQARAEFSQKVNTLRETHNVSEEDYVSAENDLKASGMEDISPEQVVKAAKLTPLMTQADDLIEPYLDQLSDDEAYDLSVEIATTMYHTPQMTSDQVKKTLAEQFEVEDIMSEIDKKVGTKKQVETKSTSRSDDLDMFED